MKNIIISIIVPVYNVEKYLKHCLDSLVNQTMQDIEIILVNDASPDNSDKIMKQYEKKYPEKINCIYLKENICQGGARNVGLKIARGKYVMFVDSDDWVDITICEKLYKKAVQNNSDVVCCEQTMTGKRSDEIDLYFNQVMGDLNIEKRTLLMGILSVGPVAKIIKKTILTENNIMFPEKIKYEDLATMPLLWLYVKHFDKVEEPLYFYYRHENSVTMKINNKEHYDIFNAANIAYEKFINRDIENEYEIASKGLLVRGFLDQIKFLIEKVNTPDRNELLRFRANVLDIIPDYKSYKYLYLRSDPKEIYGAQLLLENSEKFADFLEMGELKKSKYNHYYEYYQLVSDKTKRLIEYCRNNELCIALWGAGQKGQDFLKVNDRNCNNISYVIDKNPVKWGTILETEHRVYSFEEIVDKINVIFIANRVYYGGIKRLVKGYTCNVKLVNLEAYYLMNTQENIVSWFE